jgi:hypothetical protein
MTRSRVIFLSHPLRGLRAPSDRSSPALNDSITGHFFSHPLRGLRAPSDRSSPALNDSIKSHFFIPPSSRVSRSFGSLVTRSKRLNFESFFLFNLFELPFRERVPSPAQICSNPLSEGARPTIRSIPRARRAVPLPTPTLYKIFRLLLIVRHPLKKP